jgi:hypothetical protein
MLPGDAAMQDRKDIGPTLFMDLKKKRNYISPSIATRSKKKATYNLMIK